MALVEVLREARTRAGLSQRELARRAGTSHATVSAYEAGRIDPGAHVLERLLDAAGFGLRAELEPRVRTRSGRPAGEELVDVLDLAAYLPHRRRSRYLEAPIFPGR